MRDTFGQLVILGLVIVLVALGLWYVDVTYFAPGRMPPCRQENLPPDRLCLETALRQWGDRIVWIDARDQSSFERGHILLAQGRMYPLRKGAEYEELLNQALERLLDAGEKRECIIVFCGHNCSSAEEIAAELRELGMIEAPIYVLEDGWDRIKQTPSLVP